MITDLTNGRLAEINAYIAKAGRFDHLRPVQFQL
jgi:hypothetical protein